MRVRMVFERICRTIALGALAAGVAMAFVAHRSADAGSAWRTITLTDATDSTSNAQGVLARTVRDPRAMRDTLLFPLTALPSPSTRAAIGAMQLSGLPLRWEDRTGAAGMALSVTRDATPRAAFDVRVSRPAAGPIALRDAGGLLDSLEAGDKATPTVQGWRIASLTAPVQVIAGSGTASQRLVEAGTPKRVLVIALPGWESKFTIAALEESGWAVDGSLRISPTGVSTVGSPQRLDTARYAAVVVLDSMAVDGNALRAFAQQGGGVLLSGDALRVPSLAALRPARATEVRSATAGALLTPTPRLGLEAWELALTPDAEPVLRDAGSHGHDEVVVAARRIGAGRVVASAYRQSWRWRMEGTDDGLRDHARWWGRLLALTVPDGGSAPSVDIAAWPGDVAPHADLVALAGPPIDSAPPTARHTSPGRGFGGQVPAILYVLAAVSLLAEWASRRLRGLR